MALGSLASAFLGSLQACVAVLLTIGYGVVATQYQILRESSARDISKLAVKMFLPALLLSNVGEQLSPKNVWRYVPILVWSLVYSFTSLGIGIAATRLFKIPAWTTPAVAFNNTVSLPLVLIQSLDASGILSSLLDSSDDTTSAAIKRAKSYFLVCSLVSNSLTFALGPKLLDGEEPPENREDENRHDGAIDPPPGSREDVERGQGQDGREGGDDEADEHTSLLPNVINEPAHRLTEVTARQTNKLWDRLPSWLQVALHWLHALLVGPLIGAVFGAIIGLSPPLRRLFFNTPDKGGFFGPWLTSSVKNVGDLFAALQLVVVGCKLSGALRNMKDHKDSGSVPWGPMMFVFAVRFLMWPLISIPLIWTLATKTKLLGDDPMLWFCLMLMPTGPPAIKLTALADVNGSNEQEKMSIAKFLTIAYAVSPLICFSVVGSLRAAEAALGSGAEFI